MKSILSRLAVFAALGAVLVGANLTPANAFGPFGNNNGYNGGYHNNYNNFGGGGGYNRPFFGNNGYRDNHWFDHHDRFRHDYFRHDDHRRWGF